MAARGLTVESLLAVLSNLIVLPQQPTARDRRIERLFEKYRAAPITDKDRAALDRLIDEAYREAIARADRVIAARTSAERPLPQPR
jgi:hypothetical protein